MASLYDKRRDEGLCVVCGRQALPNVLLPAVVIRIAREKGQTPERVGHYARCREHHLAERTGVEARADAREQNTASMRERYERLKAAGLCVSCGVRESEAGKVSCGRCLGKQSERDRARRAARKAAGLCVMCGGDLDPTEDCYRRTKRLKTMCRRCRRREKAWRTSQRAP